VARDDVRGCAMNDDDTLHALTERSSDVRQALFGGVGRVVVKDLIGARVMAPFSAVLSCVLAPGATVGRHRQASDDELVVCLAGLGVFIVDEVATEAGPGTVTYVPKGAILQIENASTATTLDYLIIKATA
jgi:quercetin dioxygenase-like cupin family protein